MSMGMVMPYFVGKALACLKIVYNHTHAWSLVQEETERGKWRGWEDFWYSNTSQPLVSNPRRTTKVN
jgi:hypothetical protein